MNAKLPLAALAWFLVGATGLAAEPAARLDLNAWKRIPVYSDGRIMPLDTLARELAEEITGRESPTFDLQGSLPAAEYDSAQLAGARELFPGGKERKFSAAELVLSWLAEPEKWERVPFLTAAHKDLRARLELPLKSESGLWLKHVSPAELEDSDVLQVELRDLDQRRAQALAKGEKFEFVGVDKLLAELVEAYNKFRSLTYDPAGAEESRSRFLDRSRQAIEAWKRLSADLSEILGGDEGSDFGKLVEQNAAALEALASVASAGRFPLAEMEPIVVQLRTSSATLAKHLAERRDSSAMRQPENWSAQQAALYSDRLNRLAAGAQQFAESVRQMHLALYDPGEGLRVVPALDPAALDRDRDTAEDAQPWLPLPAVLVGSPELLADYPQAPLEAVRRQFAHLTAAYRDRAAADRPAAVREAATGLAQALRVLGSEIEPLRDRLAIANRDEALIAYTAYPAASATEQEVRYNDVDPFRWAWVISLAAFGCFCLSFGVARRPMFALGLVVMAAGLAWTVYGFYLRVCVTKWAPVTNMYETMVYVPLVVSALAAWFTLLPLAWTGIKAAWRLTAAPFTWEARGLSEEEQRLFPPVFWKAANVASLVPRLLLMRVVYEVLAVRPYAAGGRTILNLWPTRSGEALDFNNLLTWSVGLLVLVPTVWYLPRVLTTAAFSLVAIPWSLVGRFGQAAQQTLERRWFVLAGTFVAFLGTLLAWYAPVFDESFSPLTPVLRDNFWLTIHVLTIVSSYGAGLLAWGLGNIALLHYLVGRYPKDAGGVARPPAACAALAGYVYKSMQVAVLLLAAGTILGGLWADVSWGRFWGWDPKEVWALVSLLVYMAILHGRYAGWFGNFGLAAGSVLGASAIAFSWYGVNFVLGVGLHSYGFGAGGQYEVGSFVAANWLLLAAAAWRYRRETGGSEEIELPQAA
jgi:ABC-type transport system involved in cytochrome c biogenesis permease subunit